MGKVVDPARCFSHTVPEAHERFLEAAGAAGASLESVAHPLPGPSGEALHSAVATLGDPHAPTAALVISGTHGIEGYAGCGLQVGALLDRPEVIGDLGDLRVVFVHQSNPWGAAWSRKENEDNQELLRHYAFCHHGGSPNPIFDDVYDTVGFQRAGSVEELLAASRRFRDVVARHGAAEVQAALVRGQSNHPDAMTYHGGEPAWSKRLLDRVVVDHLSGARRIAVLDLHTAVGPYGECVVLDEAPPGSLDAELVAEWFGHLTPWPEEPKRAYGWIESLVPGATVVSATIEVGTETLGPNDQIIFPLDCWMRSPERRLDPANREIIERYRRYFYPEEPAWMSSAWATGRPLLSRFFAGVRAWGHDPGA